jgi:DNA-binding response OmpR family regulator
MSEEFTEIKIKDTGLGIGEKDLPQIFNRFYRASDDGVQQEEGLGVGLALSQKLIELHHGTLTAGNRKDRGSIFTIRLLNGIDHFEEDQVEKRTKIQSTKTKNFTPESVGLKKLENGSPKEDASADGPDKKALLIIDDNRDICEFVREVMEPDYRVLQAYDGVQGLEVIKEELPDIILCDVMMPEMDGFELSRKLKEDAMTEAVPIIFLTGRAGKSAQLEGLDTGADDYITKPFDTKLLQTRVKNLIDQRMRLRRRLRQELNESAAKPVQSAFEKDVRQAILENLTNEQFGVEKLAQEAAISSSHLAHKLKDEAGITPSELIRSIRLERAAELLKNREGNISEVAYSVGFNSLSYFSRCFKNEFGKSPSAYLSD